MLSLLICAGVAWRVFDLQVLEFEHFRTLSESNRVSLLAVPPTRGIIYDRNGVVLAQNTPTYSLEVTPEAVEDMNALIAALGELVEISDIDLERFHTALAKARRFDSIPLRFRLSPEEVARIAVNRPYLPGADFKARLARTYPHGDLGAHLIGYVGRIDERDRQSIDTSNYRGTSHIGKTGVEQQYEGCPARPGRIRARGDQCLRANAESARAPGPRSRERHLPDHRRRGCRRWPRRPSANETVRWWRWSRRAARSSRS